MSRAVRTYNSIDDYLGPRAGRFFGTGFKRVSRQLRHVTVDPHGRTIAATASLRYPTDWSTKSTSSSLVPHLSTIDAGVLSMLLGESYLTSVFTLSAEQRRTMWLRRLVIRAGVRPQEQLSDFDISAQHLETRVEPVGMLSVLDCRFGGLRTRCEFVHEQGNHRSDDRPMVLPDGFLGDPVLRYYGTGFQERDQEIHDIRLDPSAAEVSATVNITTGGWHPDGLEGGYQPSVSVVDGMVVLAQLAQSLLYRLDDIERADSDTLWMRQVDISTDTPSRSIDGPFRSSTSVTRSRLLILDGAQWRTSDWTADFRGLRFRYRLGHRLPAIDKARTR